MVTEMQGTYSVEPLMRTTLPGCLGAVTTAACGCNRVAGVPGFFADWLINAQQMLHQTTDKFGSS